MPTYSEWLEGSPQFNIRTHKEEDGSYTATTIIMGTTLEVKDAVENGAVHKMRAEINSYVTNGFKKR